MPVAQPSRGELGQASIASSHQNVQKQSLRFLRGELEKRIAIYGLRTRAFRWAAKSLLRWRFFARIGRQFRDSSRRHRSLSSVLDGPLANRFEEQIEALESVRPHHRLAASKRRGIKEAELEA